MADSQIIMVKEIWKTIPGFPPYEVSNLGRIRSWNKRKCPDYKIMNPAKSGANRDRYFVILRKDGKYHQRYIHRLVLEAFVGPCPPGMECCHNDGNSFNNVLTNLRWDTHMNNELDKIKHDTLCYGEKKPEAKLTKKNVIEIRKLYASGEKAQILAKRFNVTRNTITRIASGERWRRAPGPTNVVKRLDRLPRGRDNHFWGGYKTRGSRNGRAILSENQVLDVRRKHREGHSIKSLADIYSVSYATIQHIIKRISWKHI